MNIWIVTGNRGEGREMVRWARHLGFSPTAKHPTDMTWSRLAEQPVDVLVIDPQHLTLQTVSSLTTDTRRRPCVEQIGILERDNLEMIDCFDDVCFKPLNAREFGFRLQRAQRRRDVQKRLQATRGRLQESQERFTQLTENIDIVFWLAVPDLSRMLYVSPAYETIWQRSRETLYGNPQSWFDPIHPDDRAKSLALDREGLSSKVMETFFRILREDGAVVWINNRIFPIPDAHGNVYRIAGIARDVTEEMRLRQESEQRLQQIIQADRLAALGEVVAGVAHEINNPNSFITYNVPILEESWNVVKPILSDYAKQHPEWHKNGLPLHELMDDMQEITEAIRIGSDRINRVVSNLKDFARLDKSDLKKAVDINAVIDKTLAIVGPQMRKSVNDIHIALADQLPLVQGHFQKLEQVAANLLVNACHAVAGQKRGRLSIATRFIERLRCVLIEIEDNGPGMEPALVDRIFEPFVTTRRSQGGTGLGLSVSYGLVKEHNGIIGVFSKRGAGSRFTVYLPVDENQRLELNPTILCVDDDKSVLKLLESRFLNVKDAFIETTSDPAGVLAYLEAHPEVDIVLSDIMMPGIDGWDLLAKIKTRFPLMSVILYSGDLTGVPPDPQKAALADGLLEKPFNFSELIKMMYAIGRQRL